MKLKIKDVSEGVTRLLVPENERPTKKGPIFFNPEMELSRDISVAIVRVMKPETFCDLFSGSGARGIRIANETNARVLANDINPMACDLINRNMGLNSLDIEIKNLEGNFLLAGKRFDFIDIDPFGSPTRFVESAIRSLNNKGVLAVTATDTAALCGTYPRACLRKYDATSLRTDYYNELGLRILIGFIAREAIRYEKGILPLFSHCTMHYFRTYLQIKRGGLNLSRSIKNLGYMQHCFKCLNRRYSFIDELEEKCQCNSRFQNSGPLWRDIFADPEFCIGLKREIDHKSLRKAREALKLIEVIGVEQEIKKPYYNIHKVFKRIKSESKPMDKIIEAFENRGFKAIRTHFSNLGLRIDADISDLSNVISNNVK